MHLTIFDRYRPFSHKPGTAYLLPGTSLVFRVFPTVICVEDLHDEQLSQQLKLAITGPIREFTSQIDLESSTLDVWGHAIEGYFKYRISSVNGSFQLTILKEPTTGLKIEGDTSFGDRKKKPISLEKLYLGVSKKQEWSQVSQRCDIREILPFWYSLHQTVQTHECSNAPSLFAKLKQAIESHSTEAVGGVLQSIYKTAFNGVFVPSFFDYSHLGYPLPSFEASSPLAIISHGGRLIRSLFVANEGSSVDILPILPVEFHSGRLINIKLPPFGELDIEWTKKTVRRVIFRCSENAELTFKFQTHLKSYRLRKLEKHNGVRLGCGEPYAFSSGLTYEFDNFQK